MEPLNKNKMKKTAVEWLVEQMKLDELFNADYFIEQAKEMEEEQIENAFNYGQFDLGMEADEYYNLIYKSE
jgi:hypothetical protein